MFTCYVFHTISHMLTCGEYGLIDDFVVQVGIVLAVQMHARLVGFTILFHIRGVCGITCDDTKRISE
jgi:hypothetical protein